MVSGSARSSSSPSSFSTQIQRNSPREQGQDHYSLFIAHNMEGVGSWVRKWVLIVQVSKCLCLFSGSANTLSIHTNKHVRIGWNEMKTKKKRDVLQGMCGLPLTLTLTMADPAYPCSLFSVPCSLFLALCSSVPVSISVCPCLSVLVCALWWKAKEEKTTQSALLLSFWTLLWSRMWWEQDMRKVQMYN